MTDKSGAKMAVLTRRWTWYGEYVLRLLGEQGVRPTLILIENTTVRTRLRLAHRLARRIGWVNAIRYNIGFWGPVVRRFLGADRSERFHYELYSDRVIEAGDINAPQMAAGLIDHGIDRILLAHSGIVRRAIWDIENAWIINAHPGFLPRMRGVDVIRWSILEQVPPAVTVHVVEGGVDTGPIIYREPIVPVPGERLHEFERRVCETAARKLVECALAGPAAFPEPQRQSPEDGRQYYLMPFKWVPRVEEQFASINGSKANHGAA